MSNISPIQSFDTK